VQRMMKHLPFTEITADKSCYMYLVSASYGNRVVRFAFDLGWFIDKPKINIVRSLYF